MFGIGGFNPVSLLATAAFGPAGGLIAQLATQVVSQIGQQLIQNLGNQLNLPQSQIDLAQSSFAASNGDFQGSALNLNEAVSAFGGELGQSPADIGAAQGDVEQTIRDMATSLSETQEFKDAKSGGKGGSWLMAMARALGEKADKIADDMQQMAENMKSENSKPSDSLEFGAKSQEFSLFMNAATNAIKTAGESLTTASRKGG